MSANEAIFQEGNGIIVVLAAQWLKPVSRAGWYQQFQTGLITTPDPQHEFRFKWYIDGIASATKVLNKPWKCSFNRSKSFLDWCTAASPGLWFEGITPSKRLWRTHGRIGRVAQHRIVIKVKFSEVCNTLKNESWYHKITIFYWGTQTKFRGPRLWTVV